MPWPRSFAGRRVRVTATNLGLAVALAVLTAWRLRLLFWRFFDADELLAVHGGWAMAHGEVLYRDLFETHPPWLHALLTPLFWVIRPDTSAGRAMAVIFLGRGLMFLCTVGIMAATIWLGRLWKDIRVGAVGAVLLVTTFAFQQKTLEIRGDVPAVLLLLVALGVVMRRTDSGSAAAKPILAGVALGAMLMFTTKAVFALPGFALGAATLSANARGRDRVATMARIAIGVAIPLFATALYFMLRGGFPSLVEDLVTLAIRWKVRYGLAMFLRLLVAHNPAIMFLGLMGWIRAGTKATKARSAGHADGILFLTALTLIIGLVLSPSVFFQYHLLYLPLWGLLAASVLVDAAEFVLRVVPRRAPVRNGSLLAVVAATALTVYVWIVFHERNTPTSLFNWRRDVWPLLIQLAAAAGIVALTARFGAARLASLACGVAIIAVLPAYHLVVWEQYNNRPQRDQLTYVIKNSTPSDEVLDGFTGVGAFRRQAFPYFLAYDVQQIVPRQERSRLRQDLEDGSVGPQLVILDWNLRNFLGRRTVTALRRRYLVGYARSEVVPYEPTRQLILKRP